MSFDALEKFLDGVIATGDAVEDTIIKADSLKGEGEGILGKGFILGDSAQAHVNLVRKLGKRIEDAKTTGKPASTLGTLFDVGEFILKR